MSVFGPIDDGAAAGRARTPAAPGGLAARLSALVLRPADEVAAERAASRPTAGRARDAAEGPRLALLVPGGCGEPVGEAVALAIARRTRSDVPVLAIVGEAVEDDDPAPVPLARPVLRRTAAALRAHGLSAQARRVVRVGLPAAGPALLAGWQRTTVVAPQAAVVLLVDGPRTEDHEHVLAEQDAIVAVASPGAASAVSALAAAGTSRLEVVGADLPGPAAQRAGVLAHRLTPVRAVVAAAHAALEGRR